MNAHALFALLSDSRVWVPEVVPYATTSLQGPCAQNGILNFGPTKHPFLGTTSRPVSLRFGYMNP